MSRILKFILFLVLFLVFFEAGLISSYTIVTSQPPDVGQLIGMQIDRLLEIFDFREDVSSALEREPDTLNVTNSDEVAQALKTNTNLDGIDLDSINATTFASKNDDMIPVNITAMGFREDISGANASAGQIIITPSSDHIIKATAMGKLRRQGIEIDLNTIQIVSLGRLYSQARN